MKNKYQKLTEGKWTYIPDLLQKLEYFYDGTLGTWKTDPVDFELKVSYKTIFSQPYPVPNLHKKIFNKKVGHLVSLEVLENSNESECGDPYFPQPKPETNRVSFISVPINLNMYIKRKPNPIPKINGMLLK